MSILATGTVPLNWCRHLSLAQCHSKGYYQFPCWQFSIKEQFHLHSGQFTVCHSLQSVTLHPASCNTLSRQRCASLSLLQLLNVCLEIQVAITVIRVELFCCTGGPVKGTCAKRMFPCAKEQLNWLLKIFTFRRIYSAYNIMTNWSLLFLIL
jgi:hypothetical protein